MKHILRYAAILAVLALGFSLASCKNDVDDDEPTMYTVTVSSSIEHGKVSVDKTSAEAGATVKLTATADDGYELEAFSAKDASANALTVTNGTFTMPKSNVTVSATFKAKSGGGTTGSGTTSGGTETGGTTTTGGGTGTGGTTTTGGGTTSSGTTSDGTEKQAGSISYATASVSKTTADAAFINELTKTGDGTVSYASDNTAVATVDSDGLVTIVGAGTATITATVTDSETYTYATKTATYTLTVTQAITYIGTKAPTEPKAVGDIVFNDGSATAYTSGLMLTNEQKAAAVAVIFYAGSSTDTLGAKTLGVGLKNETGTNQTLSWARYTDVNNRAEGYYKSIDAIRCSISEEGAFTGDLDGSDNWEALCAAVNDEGTRGNYPAWEWVNDYATKASPSLPEDFENGWYFPTVAELSMMYREKSTVNTSLDKAGGTKIADTLYWSSNEFDDPSTSNNTNAFAVNFSDGSIYAEIKSYLGSGDYKTFSVCAIRQFN